MVIKINLFEDLILMQGRQVHIYTHVHMQTFTCGKTHMHTEHTSANSTTFYSQ